MVRLRHITPNTHYSTIFFIFSKIFFIFVSNLVYYSTLRYILFIDQTLWCCNGKGVLRNPFLFIVVCFFDKYFLELH